jgi:hypothetical protein
VTDEVDFQAKPVSCHAQLFQRGAGTGKIATRDQCHNPLNLSWLERNPVSAFSLDLHPGLPHCPFPR